MELYLVTGKRGQLTTATTAVSMPMNVELIIAIERERERDRWMKYNSQYSESRDLSSNSMEISTCFESPHKKANL